MRKIGYGFQVELAVASRGCKFSAWLKGTGGQKGDPGGWRDARGSLSWAGSSAVGHNMVEFELDRVSIGALQPSSLLISNGRGLC